MAYTASNLVDSLVYADNIWADNMARHDYTAHVETVRATREQMTATVTPAANGKKVSVNVWWINACDITDQAIADDCAPSGTALSTDSATYNLDLTREAVFSVPDIALRTNAAEFNQLVAKGLLKASKVLDEWMSKQIIAKIEANEGTPDSTFLPAGWTWVGADKHTTVPGADWTTSMLNRLDFVGEMNDMASRYILTGSNLYIEYMEAMQNMANAEGKGDAARVRLIPTYSDPRIIDTVNAPDKKTYLIARGALAFGTYAWYGQTPTDFIGAGQSRFSIESRNLPGVRYDVIYTNSCSGNEITHTWAVQASAGVWLNPTGCTATKTGILTFVNEGGAAI